MARFASVIWFAISILSLGSMPLTVCEAVEAWSPDERYPKARSRCACCGSKMVADVAAELAEVMRRQERQTVLHTADVEQRDQ